MSGWTGRIGQSGTAAPLLMLSLTLLAGCSTVVNVRSLATGRVEVAAYALRGADIPALQREADMLCPRGGEVVYQASRNQRTVPADSRVKHWLQQATSWLDTPRGEAQMMVVCSELQGNRLLLATPTVNPPAPAPVPTKSPAPLPPPVGPLAITW